ALLAGLSGPAYVEMAQILASNPPIPPPSLIQEVQLGMYMTSSQAVTYAGIAGATGKLLDVISHPDGYIGGAMSDAGRISVQAVNVAGLINSEIQSSKKIAALDMNKIVINLTPEMDLEAVGGAITKSVTKTVVDPKAVSMVEAANKSMDAMT